MSDVTILSGQELAVALTREVEEICKISRSLKPHITPSESGVTVHKWAPKSVARTTSPGLSNVVRRIFLDGCDGSEKTIPGSGDVVLRLSSSISLKYLRDRASGRLSNLTDVQDDFRKITSQVPSHTTFLTGSEILEVVDNLSSHPRTASLVKDVIRHTNPITRITVKDDPRDFTVIELKSGSTFKVDPLIDCFGRKWERAGAKVVLIDGIIERVSEVDILLTRASEDKHPLVIVARGFSPDVVSTLAVNMVRGTLDVLPVQVPHDVSGVNSLVDMAAVLGCDVTSSLKGDLVSSIKWEEVVSCQTVKVVGRQMTLVAERKSTIDSHVRHLEERARESSPESREILEARIRSVTSKAVEVTLSHDMFTRRDEITWILNILKGYITSGAVNVGQVSLDHLVDEKFLPASILRSALTTSLSIVESILSLQVAVLVDDK